MALQRSLRPRSAAVSAANRAGGNAGGTSTPQAKNAISSGTAALRKGIRIRKRGPLPHWEREGGTYFVTFRLADSLPHSVLRSLESERKTILRAAKQSGRELPPSELKRAAELFSERIEKHLDSGAGACHLARPEIAQLVASALQYFDGGRYRLWAWCVMPNHVHVVVELQPGQSLEQVLHSWKSYTSRKANAVLYRQGQFWQREYYDHLIRDEQALYRLIRCVEQNPAKARLKNWRWVWARTASAGAGAL